MIGALMDYGALTTKVRALYGKRLRLSDFQHMAAAHSVEELYDLLRLHPAWSAASERLADSAYIGRIELEQALWRQFRSDYQKLSYYFPRSDRALMSFPILLQEQRAILITLRRLKSGQATPLPPVLPHSTLDLKALSVCRGFDELTAAAKDTIYFSALRRLRASLSDPLPDYTAAETLLRSTYFSHMYRIIHKNYAGETQKVLLRSYGEQIDWFNILHILRLKTYFPNEQDYLPVLFPFNYHLRPELIRAMCRAPDVSAVLELLRDTPYSKSFASPHLDELEDRYYQAFYIFQRRQLTTGTPSIYTAVAYLNLRELELHALIGLIEAIKYGVPYDLTLARLMGDRAEGSTI